MATSVARLTFASTTPSVLRRNRSIRLLHDAQVIPTTGNETSTGAWSAPAGRTGAAGAVGTLALILPRSITGRQGGQAVALDRAAGRAARSAARVRRQRVSTPGGAVARAVHMDLDDRSHPRNDARMANKKTGDPRDGEQHDGGARFMPVGCGFGETAVVVPAPMTCGRPQPEPEERWTLAPGRRTEPTAGSDDEPAAEGVPVEPVRATVTRRAAGGGEPDRA